jgi:hypothetical protein
MKTRIIALSILLVATIFVIAQSLPISRFPNTPTPFDSDLFVLAQTQFPATNKNIRYDQLRGAIRSGLATETYVLVTSNSLFGTSAGNGSNLVVVLSGTNTLVVMTSTNGTNFYIVNSTASGGAGFDSLEIQTNSVRLGLITNQNWTYGVTGSVSSTTAILGVDDSAANNAVSNGLINIINTTSNVLSGGFDRLEIQTNGVRVGLVTNINYTSGVTGFVSSTTANLGVNFSSVSLVGSTNTLNLSVQAGKLPTANYPTIDASWNDWELVYYQTNDAGTKSSIASSWQFVVPPDYTTNTMNVRLVSTLTVTNGPNSSNVIWGVSFFRVSDAGTNDLHNLTFGPELLVTNTWTASPTATNLVKYAFAVCGTNSALSAKDLAIIKVARKGDTDTAIAPSALVGLQLEYTRQ